MKLSRKTVKETYLQLISSQNRSIKESNLTWKPISWRLSVQLLPWRSRRTLRIFLRYTRHCYLFKLSQLWPKNISEIATKRQQDNNFSRKTQGFLFYIAITSRVRIWGPRADQSYSRVLISVIYQKMIQLAGSQRVAFPVSAATCLISDVISWALFEEVGVS